MTVIGKFAGAHCTECAHAGYIYPHCDATSSMPGSGGDSAAGDAQRIVNYAFFMMALLACMLFYWRRFESPAVQATLSDITPPDCRCRFFLSRQQRASAALDELERAAQNEERINRQWLREVRIRRASSFLSIPFFNSVMYTK